MMRLVKAAVFGAILTVLPACVAGAGPVIGIGEHRGLFFGGEGIAGSESIQLAGGVTVSPGGEGSTGYGRLDLVDDQYNSCADPPTGWAGYRAGFGFASADKQSGGSVMIGGDALSSTGINERRAGVVFVQLRYVRGWQLVLGARYEQHKPEHDFCGDQFVGDPPTPGGGIKRVR